MHIVRALGSGVVLVGLVGFGLSILPGCGDQDSQSGTVVKVDEAEEAKRRERIKDLYKSKAAGQQTPSAPAGGPRK